MDRLYLDYNATSPLSTSVIDWLKSGDVVFANPSSQHSLGKAARKIINESRASIYSAFQQDEKKMRLLFHSGATEATVTIASSMSEHARVLGKRLLICSAKTDHPAVTSLKDRYWGEHVEFYHLKQRDNLEYDHAANLEFLKRQDAVILYHHLWVHNETGLISPLKELEALSQIPNLFLHIDGVQAPGKIPDWQELSCGDVWTFSAHKFGALKGIGLSFMRDKLPFYPLLSGGGQQQGLRGGTENPQGIKSVALALQDLRKVDVAHTQKLKEELEDFLRLELKDMGEILSGGSRNSNTIYFYLHELSSDVALALFDLNGLMISAGSACSSGAARPSIVLTELGLGPVAKNGLRISLPLAFDEEFLNKVKSRLSPIFNKLRA